MEHDTFFIFIVVSLVAVLVLACFVVWIVRKKEWKVERVYVVCGIVFGAVYLFLIPFSSVPDEPVHINAAYHYSNVMLHTVGEKEAKGKIVKRVCDTDWLNHTQQVTRKDYTKFLNGLVETHSDTSLTVEAGMPAIFNVSYCISGAGIALGRLLHFNAAWTYLLGRLIQMVLFVLAIRYAIRKIPTGKVMLFVMALFPMTLQQTSSYSYDSLTIGCSFFITAMAFYFAFHEDAVQKKDIVYYILASVLLVCSKGGVYSLIVFLPFLLMFCRKRITKKNVLVFVVSVLAVALLAGRTAIADRLTDNGTADKGGQHQHVTMEVQEETPRGAYVEYMDSYAYSLGEMIEHPSIIAHHYVDTLLAKGRYYLETMVGSELASLSIPISGLFIYSFLVMAFVGTLEGRTRAVSLRMIDRVGIWAITLFACVVSMFAMFLYWTPKESPIILGVQGRYFLPVLPVFFLSFQNRRLRIWKNIDKIIICLTVFLNIGVMVQVLHHSW